jgi:hypothetical protein
LEILGTLLKFLGVMATGGKKFVQAGPNASARDFGSGIPVYSTIPALPLIVQKKL